MSKHDNHGKHNQPPKVVFPTIVATHGDLTLYSDGSLASQQFEEYFKGYTGPGHLVHNFFFSDTGYQFKLTKEQADNVAYNQANVWGPLGQFIKTVGDTLQGFSAVRGDDGRFDPKSVNGLPYAEASREPVAGIPAILAYWKSQNYFPTVVEQTWAVV